MLSELVYKLQTLFQGLKPLRALDLYDSRAGEPRGHALVSYVPLPMLGAVDRFQGHSNVWECAEIVRIFNRLGYMVDLISWQDTAFVPRWDYDVVFDIHRNLSRFAGPTTRAVFHVTGSNPVFSNGAEARRLAELLERRGVSLAPCRSVCAEDLRIFAENLERADLITLIGNEVTESTFPSHLRGRIRRVTATGAFLPEEAQRGRSSVGREFLWFNGTGAVHKGLDLTLEVFTRHPELVLHLVGPYLKEIDFVDAYRRELTECPNIRSHGFLYPASRKFRQIADRVSFFVSPSCSEGISTSAITCMQMGMIPVVSANTGITLPPDSGCLLQECSVEVIESAVLAVTAKGDNLVREESTRIRDFARETFSREQFYEKMMFALHSLLQEPR
jgi:glycosyltransferase involved in cell wall biosynthesis